MRKKETAKKKRNKKHYIFLLKEFLPIGISIDIAASTNKKMILKKANESARNLSEEIWRTHRLMPYHKGKSDDEVRQYLREHPDPTRYEIFIFDSNNGEFIKSVIVTEKTTLPEY